MTPRARSFMAFAGRVGLAVALTAGALGCSPQGGSGGSSGGAPGSSGGAPGSGGASSSSGGAIGSGGAPATGGASGSGGRSGATGGSTAASGGAPATGGSGTGGGAPGSGGAAATGGRAGAAGNSVGGSAGSGSGGRGVGGAGGGSMGSPGCGKPLMRPNPRTQQTVDIGGTTRYYLLDVPAAADNQTPLSLVFALHGYDMNNVSVVGLYNFTSRSGGKAITVYPQGEGPAPGDTSHWGDGVLKSTWTANQANYTFIQTLLTDIQQRFCVDTSRVFLTGFSMGGMFTNSLACAHNDWFRGFAPVEGGGPGSCANKMAQPAVIVHQGTGDTLVTPMTGEATRDFWRQQNGCAQTMSAMLTGCQGYGGCVQPVLYCVGTWGHTIDSKATANIWAFFNGLP